MSLADRTANRERPLTDYHAIDIAWLRRKQVFSLGQIGTLSWSRGEQITGAVQFRVEREGMRLLYRVRRQSVDDLIPFATTATQFAGERTWFACPVCNRHCRIVYGGVLFRCRLCYELVYPSQYEPPALRISKRLRTIRERVGGDASFLGPFPSKPPLHALSVPAANKRQAPGREVGRATAG
jgi:hypothetical protein